ncbi:PQQ-dependent sugar dehydrogenase [Mucilaginibacter sp. JRF]|uniref:PQQ-dependent sugar dehydrogenase n=1 Tax=Mucilaginibacter sp. JRF TaxID=2780088 RepID=UPI00187F4223|nr:PQQ-dependent sugar dehydrogenase [Mucilaginibacter sp. JRF]MBE9586160.1 PQQ-dependent sugar dehydrogenase [Mucilaginibacter sp. JRF]
MKIKIFMAASAVVGLLVASSFIYQDKDSVKQLVKEPGFKIDTLATGLIVPWQITFLPDGAMLFTERAGRVRLYRGGKLLPEPVFTVEDVAADRKMGLLGLALHPDFKKNNYVYVASNYTEQGDMKLKVLRYVFKGGKLQKPLTVIEGIPANQNHTGCRLVFGPDRKLYITAGDADKPAQAQDLKALNGKILRVSDDGSIPADNPFAKNDTARKQIWSYGHRNPQGLVFQPGTNILFDTEHGPTGGDEVNIIHKGENYGWPIIHHRDTRAGMNTPLLEYTPSIGPGEAMFYNGNAFSELKGDLLVACLRGEGILHIKLKGTKVVSQGMLFKKQFGRIRSLVTGPDGSLYLSTSMIDEPESRSSSPFDMIIRISSIGKQHNFPAQPIAGNTVLANARPTTPQLFQQLCAACHGDKLQGTEKTKALLGGNFAHGSDKKSIVNNITNGITEKGMPAWGGAVSAADIDKLADFILVTSKKQ